MSTVPSNNIKTAIIDSREPSWIQDVRLGCPKLVAPLDYGDAMLATEDDCIVLVERKTPADLLGSIKDDRLFAQVAGMRTKTQWSYLVVTGTLEPTPDGKVAADGRKTGWGWSSVQGALLTVQESGVPVYYVASDDEYQKALSIIAGRQRNKEHVIDSRMDSRMMSTGEQILTSFPGIGQERAKTLLDQFDGCVASALAWLTWRHRDPCFDIAGIGVGVKYGVRKALQLDDSQEFDIVTLPQPEQTA